MGRVMVVASVVLFAPALALAAQTPAQEASPAVKASVETVSEGSALVAPVQVFVARLTATHASTGWSGLRKAGTQPDKATAPSPADDGFGTGR